MKRITFTALMVIFLAGMCYAQLLTNASFEDNNLTGWTTCNGTSDPWIYDCGWEINNGGHAPTPASYWDNAGADGGSFRASGGGGGCGGALVSIGQDITLSGGLEYDIDTVWVPGVEGGNDAILELRAGAGAAGTYLCSDRQGGTLVATETRGPNVWGEVTGKYTPVADGSYTLWVNIQLPVSVWTCVTHFDGIFVETLPASVETWALNF